MMLKNASQYLWKLRNKSYNIQNREERFVKWPKEKTVNT